ncbi:ATP-grasp domain-containing protein [Halobacteriales archaeon Cl-PHB]
MVPVSSGSAVVVPAVNSASSACCLRSLGKRGVHTIAVSEQAAPPGFASKYVDETVRVPSFEDDLLAYKEGLLALARRDDVRAIATLREVDVYVLSRYYDEFAAHVGPTWPDMPTLRTAQDRLRLVEAADAAGVAAPETKRFGDVDDWDRDQIVKGRYGLLAGEYVDAMDDTDYATVESTRYLDPGVDPDADEIYDAFGHEPIVQEYVPGDEFALWALYDEGEAVATCLKRQVRAYKYEGGTSVCRETVELPALERAGRQLLDQLDWHGPAAVQFKRHPDTGEFVLLEVNPRFWVSLACAVRAGLDFPYYFWLLSEGPLVSAPDSYEPGVATHLLRGELVHLHSVLRGSNPYVDPPALRKRALTVARSLVTQPNFDYLTLDDPGPFVRDGLNTVDELLGSVLAGPVAPRPE